MITIIFDFDGTIANTFEIMYQTINDLAPQYGYQPFTPSQAQDSRHHSTMEILRHLRFSRLKIPSLSIKVRRQLTELMPLSSLYPGISSTIGYLSRFPCRLGILTSNSQTNVKRFLDHNHLDLFDFIYGGSNLFGKSRRLKKIIKREKLIPAQTLYVGDEPRDVIAAKKNHLISVAVTWGFKSRSLLSTHQPDFLIDHPKQLKDVLKTIHP